MEAPEKIYLIRNFPTTNIELIKKDVVYTAKKFFELGLKAKG